MFDLVWLVFILDFVGQTKHFKQNPLTSVGQNIRGKVDSVPTNCIEESEDYEWLLRQRVVSFDPPLTSSCRLFLSYFVQCLDL